MLRLLRQLRATGAKQLTVLLLGKGGAGKSSTINSILGEQARAASVSIVSLCLSPPRLCFILACGIQ